MATRIAHYDIGDLWLPQATFTVGGAPTDPTNLTVRQQDPAGAETVLLNNVAVSTLTTSSTPIAKVSTGVFKANPGISLTTAGYWFLRFEGTGTAAAAEEHQAIVDPSEFTSDSGLSSRALVGLAEMKDWLQQQNIATSNDLDLVDAINGVSELAHNEAEREFKRTDSTSSATLRTFQVDELGYRNRFIAIGDLSTTPTLVRILATDWSTSLATVTDYRAYPQPRPSWAPITHLEFRSTVLRPRYGQLIEVTGVWGFPSIPTHLKDAVKDAVAERMDADVEHYRQDVAPVTAGAGTNVIVFGSRPAFLPANPRSLAVFRSFKEPSIG